MITIVRKFVVFSIVLITILTVAIAEGSDPVTARLAELGLDFSYVGKYEDSNGKTVYVWKKQYDDQGSIRFRGEKYTEEGLNSLIEAHRTFFFPWENEDEELNQRVGWSAEYFNEKEYGVQILTVRGWRGDRKGIYAINQKTGKVFFSSDGSGDFSIMEGGKILIYPRFITKVVTGGEF